PGGSSLAAPPTSGGPNEVRTVLLYSVPIVALVIEGQERLSLAQISNTLLKDYSYNEIHNRRVALGITCVQCTPVQLELLRRAGAMPVSSRRCGMITKREAERLCKSFLTDTPPPKLPENFAFDVAHQCAWGCRGNFVPARYNSSRAKCIKCAYCALFFSPNKFIFHSHRLPDSKYVQPDAANFNSWRRHIKLNGTPPEDVSYAWEDVKAMFNGGSRRRVAVSSSSSSSASKRPRMSGGGGAGAQDRDAATTAAASSKPSAAPPYFPVLPLSSSAPMPALFPPPLFCLAGKPLSPNTGLRPSTFGDYVWMGAKQSLSLPSPYAAAGVLWPPTPSHRLLPPPPDPGPYSSPLSEDPAGALLPPPPPPSTLALGLVTAGAGQAMGPVSYTSAFRPVAGGVARMSKSPTLRAATPTCDTTTDTGRVGAGAEDAGSDCGRSEDDDDSDSFHGEVDVTDTSSEDGLSGVTRAAGVACASASATSVGAAALPTDSGTGGHRSGSESAEQSSEQREARTPVPDTSDAGSEPSAPNARRRSRQEDEEEEMAKPVTEPENTVTSVVQLIKEECRKRDSVKATASPSETRSPDDVLDPRNIFSLSKDELRDVLLKEAEGRKKAEREFHLMRETFEEQVQKEIAYREELAKQLQVVRDALCQELDQERKARFAVQAKLKEVSLHYQQIQQRSILAESHDTMHHFACKILGPRHCAECNYKPE
ncbi:SKI family transcriptional corepressor 1 homolog-B, partial [Ixodes scapularis]|uniref:SKI family transcriptional corepressor 1 homolog-B n=1 Tax=Ixodes scapularis TaxID=6945 RepID=UPI0011618623